MVSACKIVCCPSERIALCVKHLVSNSASKGHNDSGIIG